MSGATRISPATINRIRERVDLAAVIAEELPLTKRGSQLWACCPFHSERSPSFTVHPRRQTFKCHGCGAGGDVFAWLERRRGLSFREAVAWLAGRLGVDAEVEAVTRRRGTPPPPRRIFEELPPSRPPADEVRRLWASCHRVDSDDLNGRHPAAVASAGFYLRRDLHPMDLAELGIVRELPLPEAGAWPEWWPRSWASTWRLAVLAFEPDGQPASLHARAVVEGAQPKTRWPRGFQAAGLLFACHKSRRLLRGEPMPELRRVVIVEGLTDLLRAALVTQRRPELAVLGATSGGFPALARVAWPEGVEALAATDADPAGDRYALEIAEALHPLRVRRLDLEAL